MGARERGDGVNILTLGYSFTVGSFLIAAANFAVVIYTLTTKQYTWVLAINAASVPLCIFCGAMFLRDTLQMRRNR